VYIGGFGNSLKTTYGYWGTGGAYDTAGGYYGKLWEIKTAKQPGSSPVLLDIKHTWDAGGNLSQREDVVATQTETFGYDFLDRLTSVSGAYTESYAYNQIGNITTKNATAYTYGAKPHAVTAVGPTSYTYDANGNMITRGSDNVTWDVENRPTAVSDNNTYVYDGDGKRVKKTESGQTILYINQYYEKNLTTGEITTYYFSGGMRIAMRKGTTLQYMHQDHLTGTAVMSDSAGTQVGTTMKYYPFGTTRSGSVPTDIKFTGQRLDGTGLYYFNARYYDPVIGRFISADTIVPGAFSSQALNRYSYVINNPLQYIDPSGHDFGSVTGWDTVDTTSSTIVLGTGVTYGQAASLFGISFNPSTALSNGQIATIDIALASMGYIGNGFSIAATSIGFVMKSIATFSTGNPSIAPKSNDCNCRQVTVPVHGKSNSYALIGDDPQHPSYNEYAGYLHCLQCDKSLTCYAFTVATDSRLGYDISIIPEICVNNACVPFSRDSYNGGPFFTSIQNGLINYSSISLSNVSIDTAHITVTFNISVSTGAWAFNTYDVIRDVYDLSAMVWSK